MYACMYVCMYVCNIGLHTENLYSIDIHLVCDAVQETASRSAEESNGEGQARVSQEMVGPCLDFLPVAEVDA